VSLSLSLVLALALPFLFVCFRTFRSLIDIRETSFCSIVFRSDTTVVDPIFAPTFLLSVFIYSCKCGVWRESNGTAECIQEAKRTHRHEHYMGDVYNIFIIYYRHWIKEPALTLTHAYTFSLSSSTLTLHFLHFSHFDHVGLFLFSFQIIRWHQKIKSSTVFELTPTRN